MEILAKNGYLAYSTAWGWVIQRDRTGTRWHDYLVGRKGSYRWVGDHTHATHYSQAAVLRILSELEKGELK